MDDVIAVIQEPTGVFWMTSMVSSGNHSVNMHSKHHDNVKKPLQPPNNLGGPQVGTGVLGGEDKVGANG